jgi:plastocyanin
VRRPRSTALCGAALAIAGSAAGSSVAWGGHGSEPTTSVGIAQREFRITAYRREVPPGPVRFNVRNYGEDVHNFVVVGPTGKLRVNTEEVRSGQRLSITVTLRRQGTYQLVCTIADHAQRGMKSRFVVRKPRRRTR